MAAGINSSKSRYAMRRDPATTAKKERDVLMAQ